VVDAGETASRADAVLQLNVEDCDFDNRRARVTVKGGDTAWIVWGTGTALILPRYLRGRTAGPHLLPDAENADGAGVHRADRDSVKVDGVIGTCRCSSAWFRSRG
jgi:hypothetical protein